MKSGPDRKSQSQYSRPDHQLLDNGTNSRNSMEMLISPGLLGQPPRGNNPGGQEHLERDYAFTVPKNSPLKNVSSEPMSAAEGSATSSRTTSSLHSDGNAAYASSGDEDPAGKSSDSFVHHLETDQDLSITNPIYNDASVPVEDLPRFSAYYHHPIPSFNRSKYEAVNEPAFNAPDSRSRSGIRNSKHRGMVPVHGVALRADGDGTVNHSAHMNAAGSSSGMNHADHMMSMSFHTGYESTLLFPNIKIDSGGPFALACFLVVLFGMLTPIIYTYISLAEISIWRTMTRTAEPRVDVSEKIGALLRSSDKYTIPLKWRVMYPLFILVSRIIYFSLGYLLMLVAMAFNVWLFLSAVIGLAVGTTIVKVLITPDRCYYRQTDVPSVVQEENRESGLCCC